MIRLPFFIRRVPTLKGWPFTYKTWTTEVTEPFRRGETRVFRLPFRQGIGVGRWTETLPSEDHALVAVLGHPKPYIPGRDD
ncbi:hypothetical protein [Streptomyces sp. NPDC058268]|jgi:hypothetical protein|uniref:hypothetical protein n=1 Tax=Streptomyces sp. NPDC058268 TaxID=3346413 RepID=UPI0036DFB582